jgi:hypothetical protein
LSGIGYLENVCSGEQRWKGMSGEHIIVMVVSKQVDGDATQEHDDDVGDGGEHDLEALLLQLQCPGCSISATAPIYQCAQVTISQDKKK